MMMILSYHIISRHITCWHVNCNFSFVQPDWNALGGRKGEHTSHNAMQTRKLRQSISRQDKNKKGEMINSHLHIRLIVLSCTFELLEISSMSLLCHRTLEWFYTLQWTTRLWTLFAKHCCLSYRWGSSIWFSAGRSCVRLWLESPQSHTQGGLDFACFSYS